MKQFTVAVWLELINSNPAAMAQVRMVEDRIKAGLPLSSSEHNLMAAHMTYKQQSAA